jgi:NaMN:DMB phosphoribosyltransferase
MMKSAGGIGIVASLGNSFFFNKVGTLNIAAGGTMMVKALSILQHNPVDTPEQLSHSPRKQSPSTSRMVVHHTR